MRPEPTLKGFPLMSVCGLINLTPGRSKVGLFFSYHIVETSPLNSSYKCVIIEWYR